MQGKGDNIIRVTTQEVQLSRSPSLRLIDAPEDNKIGEKVLSRELKNLNPRRKVTSVVIHIYF
jgi:hypothetical protein